MPGQHKTAIDTNTKIELHSDSSGVTIYYTTNGAKPEPFGNHGPAAKSTFKYREPFRLAGGKKTVRAVAVAPDGIRESHVVTKAFEVDEVELDHPPIREDGLEFVNEIGRDTRAKREVQQFAHKMVTSKQAWKEISKMRQTEQMMEDMTLMGSSKYHPMTNGNIPSSAFNLSNGHGMMSPKRLPPDTATQAMRLQRETDFLKCVYCMAPRPSDPYARFCFDCGNPVPPLPQTRMPPPEPGQMGTCVECNSVVPFNAPTCVICEAPLRPQNQPQASVKLGEKLVCMVCGTANPGMLTSCVTCEARLPLVGKPVHLLNTAPPEPRSGGQMITCSKCGRINNGDARFCDWCGTKPSAPGSKLSCTRCQASNHPYAQYCGSCGTIIEPPQRPEVRNSGITVTLNQSALKSNGGPATWMPVNLSGKPVPTETISTQTVGLFYPSEREIKKRMAEDEEKLALEKQMRDRKPLLTAISPGRGYWRKQMEHVVTHLKAHAQNNAEFRALIGEPRMGKIISTVVHEDAYELSLTVNFALRGNKDPFDGDSQPGTSTREYLSSYTRGRHSSMDRYNSMESLSSLGSARKTKKKPVKKKPKKPVRKVEDKLTPEDKRLLKEVGKNGEGMPSEIQQLLDEGADPNCVDKDGYPPLHLAVINKHVDAIPILVQEGAEVDKKGPTRGNTALHEAVTLGSSELVEILLGCKANTQKKNEKGESPYDLAVKLGYESIGRKLAASLGQTALGKLIKPKSQPEFDD